MPLMFGIERSIRTTSGRVSAASSIASAPSAAPPTTSMSGAVASSLLEPGSHEPRDPPRAGRGSRGAPRRQTACPARAPSRSRARRRASRARSREHPQAEMRVVRAACSGSKPRPSSSTKSCTRPFVRSTVDLDTRRAGVLDHVAERLLRSPEEELLGLAASSPARRRPRGASRAARLGRGVSRSASAASRPCAVELGRIDLDEQPAQLTDSLPRLGGGVTQLRREIGRGALARPPRASTRRPRGPGRRRRGVGCDPAPLDLRGVDRPLEKLLSLLLRRAHSSAPAARRAGAGSERAG